MIKITILISFLLMFNLNGKECDSLIYLNNSFKYEERITNVFNYKNKKYDKKRVKSYSIFPNCKITEKDLFLYSYRKDLEDIEIIQFIFKTKNEDFDYFVNYFIENENFKKSLENINNNKTIIEISTNNNLEFRFKVIDKKLKKIGIKNEYRK